MMTIRIRPGGVPISLAVNDFSLLSLLDDFDSAAVDTALIPIAR